MKNLIIASVLVLACILTACNQEGLKENESINSEFELFKTEMNAHPDFIAARDAQHDFLSKVGSGEIDLIGIHSFFKESGIDNYTAIEPGLLKGFAGGSTFIAGMKAWNSTMSELKRNVVQVEELNAEQFQKLFSFSASVTEASVRHINCLEVFQNIYNVTNSHCNGNGGGGFDCFEDISACCDGVAANEAGDAFDDCCNNGGECGNIGVNNGNTSAG